MGVGVQLSIPESDGSPLDIVNFQDEDAPLKLMMVFDWNNCHGKIYFRW